MSKMRKSLGGVEAEELMICTELLSGWPQEVPRTVNLFSCLTPDYWSNGHSWPNDPEMNE